MSNLGDLPIVDHLLAECTDLMAICDGDGNILKVNEALASIAEKSVVELRSQSVQNLFSEKNKSLNSLLNSKIINGGDSESFISNILSREEIKSVTFKFTQLKDFRILKGTLNKRDLSNKILDGNERLKIIVDHTSDCFFILDDELNITFQNKAALKKFTHPKFNKHTNPFFASFPEETNLKFYDHFTNSLSSKNHLKFVEFSSILNCWFSIDVFPTGDELNVLVNDVSDRIVDHKINELELKTFEINILKDKPVSDILNFLLEGFKRLYPQMDTSILRIENKKLWHVASPRLPTKYCQDISGAIIGPNVGSCGSAAFLKTTIISFDIETDPKWADYKHLINPYGYQSCWSFPILSNKSLEVMATFAIYTKEKCTPSESESKSIARLCNIIKIIFEDLKHDDFVLLMNNRYKMVTRATNDAIYDWDLKTNEVYWSENLYNIFGYTPQEAYESKSWWINHVHRDDRAETIALLKDCLRNKKSGWVAEYRLECKDEGFKYVYNRGYIIYDSQNLPISIIGALQDVSALKEREIEILNQNNKLKEIAQISSHDLRRPVTSILGLTSLFNRENLAEESNGEIIDYLQKATQELDDVIHSIVAKTLEADETIYDKHIKIKN